MLPAEQVWTAEFDAPPAADPWMDDERVYVPLQARGVRTLSRETGLPVWTDSVDLAQAPLTEDGQLLLALPNEIRALDPATGTVRWTRPLERPLSAGMTAANGLVYLVTDAGEAIALRARDSEIVWRRTLGAVSHHPATVVPPDRLVLALADARVVALEGNTGDVVWERSLSGGLCAPAAARDRVFVGSTNNFFYALDAESGDERWRWRTGGDVVGAAAAGDRVYFVSLDNLLRSVNRGNGNQLWKVSIPTRPLAPPIAFDDVVLLTGVAPRFDAYNGKTGVAMGTYTAPADLQGAPLVDLTPEPFKVALVALTRDGRLSAMRPTGLMFPDPPLAPLLKLPGRELPREPRPAGARLP
jgi:eukaryotic-like serine/threonine-protein kinase